MNYPSSTLQLWLVIIYNIALLSLVAFVIYITGNLWAILILLFAKTYKDDVTPMQREIEQLKARNAYLEKQLNAHYEGE